jgi:hypothetical protein
MMASAVVNENQNNSNEVAQDSVYTNVDEPEHLEYEVPIQSGSAKHLYLKLDSPVEKHNEEDEEPVQEYEVMMPVKNVKKHVMMPVKNVKKHVMMPAKNVKKHVQK